MTKLTCFSIAHIFKDKHKWRGHKFSEFVCFTYESRVTCSSPVNDIYYFSFARNKRDLGMLELDVITLNEHDADADIADEFEDDI